MLLKKIFLFSLLSIITGFICVGGCSGKGDIDVPQGRYSTTVVDPWGGTYYGSTFITLVGTSMTFQLSSEALSITAQGTLDQGDPFQQEETFPTQETFTADAEILDTTGTGTDRRAIIRLTFSPDRDRYNGEVVNDDGNYILYGTKS